MRSPFLLAALSFTLINFNAQANNPIGDSQRCPSLSETATMTSYRDVNAAINSCFAAGHYDNALAIALGAKASATTTPEKVDDQNNFNDIGAAYTYLGNYSDALSALKSAQHFGDVGSARILAAVENNLADLFIRLSEYDQAIVAANNSLKLYRPFGKADVATSLATLVQAYLGKKELKAARTTIDDLFANYLASASNLITVYALKIDAELSLAEGDYPHAIEKANKALQYATAHQMRMELAKTFLIRAQAEHALSQDNNALTTAQQAIIIAQQQKDIESERQVWQFIEIIYRDKKRWDLAYTAKENIAILTQKLFDQKLANNIAIERVFNEVAQKDRALEKLQRETAIAQADKKAAEAQRVVVILACILVFAVVAFIYYRILYRRDLRRAEITQAKQLHLDTLKDQFLANTSHELRTPLNGIIGIINLLIDAENFTLSDRVRKELVLIRDCGVQLSEKVDAILDFSQIAAGKPLCYFEAVDLPAIISFATRLLSPIAQQKHLTLLVSVDSNLPKVHADGERIRQVLINLLNNAIKFTDVGTVTLSVKRRAHDVLLSVSDTGIGIAPDQFTTIFEPFEQVDGSLRRRHDGVGLGLAISRAIVQAHRSELIVKSELRQGSTFSFALAFAEDEKKAT